MVHNLQKTPSKYILKGQINATRKHTLMINVDNLIRDLWENRAVGITTQPLDFLDKAVLAYLRELYPYLQMISIDAKFEDAVIPKFTKSPSGWVIHDYGQAMSSSPGKYLYGPGNPELEEEDGRGGTGSGTLVRQTVETARAMVELAIDKGWPGIEIVSGTQLMQWAIYMESEERNYPLAGYSPDRQGQQKLERVKRIRREQGQLPQEARLTKNIAD